MCIPPQNVPIAKGNIDLNNRPVVRNPDGSISTVLTTGFTDAGWAVINVPRVINGKIVSQQEAEANYYNTGQHLGIYRSIRAANKAAEQLHKDQEKQYVK